MRANVAYWQIVLKSSKIAGLRKSRKTSRIGDFSRCKAL